MQGRPRPVEALAALSRLEDAAERRGAWRQAIAALGVATRTAGPPPLDGIAPEQLVAAARVCLATGLADDLDWIAAGPAAVALYEVTTALPAGSVERREFGRRVFARLYRGDASTFAAVATRIALTNAKPLEAATMRARVGLVLDLAIGSPVHADPLAFVLVARRSLFENWIEGPSTGALPTRRLAALVFAHAAREALRRAQDGDPQPRTLFTTHPVSTALAGLLADREPLVWRHAAIARGSLASFDQRLRDEVEQSLDPSLDPGAWRRAAVSLVAMTAADADQGLRQCRALLGSDVVKRDPGIAAAMIWGLPGVVEAEPDAAEELLDWITATRRIDVAEALAELLREIRSDGFGRRAAATMRKAMAAVDDAEHQTLLATLDGSLVSHDARGDTGVYGSVRRAIGEYEARGAKQAHEAALVAIGAAERVMAGVEALSSHGGRDDPDLVALLADLDASVLERARLAHLLLLGRRPGDSDATVPELDAVYDRLGGWLLGGDAEAIPDANDGPAVFAEQRRLRALLHLMDVESAAREGEGGGGRVRDRALIAVRRLLGRVVASVDTRLHRISCATLARSFDATVRESIADPSDLLLVAAREIVEPESLSAIAEGSTTTDVSEALSAYAKFVRKVSRGAIDSMRAGAFDTGTFSQRVAPRDEARVAGAFLELSAGLGSDGSYRGEALRRTLLDLARSLETVATARGLSDLVASGPGSADAVGDLEASVDAYRRLQANAVRRVMGADPGASIEVVTEVATLSALAARAVDSGVPANARQISMAVGDLTADLPSPIAAAVAQVLVRVESLPVRAPTNEDVVPLERPRTALPDWLLPRRVLGAFHVVSSLGSGGGASVFLARRFEDRHDSSAEAFALKVPQYDPNTARSLTEQEFLDLFREEAGALLSLPQHPNLARFVTFDLATRPKPILVMELIRGVSLDRAIRSKTLSSDRVIDYLDGILAGLEGMHEVGLGHLDVKPSNVIIRASDGSPVLVDFGLSGRHLRPGCGTLEYTAPEVLGVVPEDHEPIPMDADMYAFACTAFELLSGEILLDADDEATLITRHLAHDGWPDKLAALASVPELTDLARVLAACLRRDPRDRPGSSDVRAMLGPATANVRERPWPLGSDA